ncbi:MAG: hypothetical protein AB7K68_10070 [Bacteriovoracia bacterium]
MTYTTLILLIAAITFPLTANAKDVRGFSCQGMQKQGYKVSCPGDGAPEKGNRGDFLGDSESEHRDGSKSQAEYDQEERDRKADLRKMNEAPEIEGDAGEDGQGEKY